MMTALEELIQILKGFTPEQLQAFINHPTTVEVLKNVEA